MSGISLDEIVFSTGAGAVDANTLRVELSTESLAALENITVTVDNADFDIRDLTHVSDSIKVGDGTDFLAVNADGSINVVSAASAIATIKNTAETVTTTAAEVVSVPFAGRKEITIQNEGSADVYIGSSVGVTSANGVKISKNSSATYAWSDGVNIFMIAASGAQSVRFLEAA